MLSRLFTIPAAALIALSTAPAFAQSAGPDPVQQAIDQSHLTDEQKQIISFTTQVATMAGAVSVCDQQEADYIRTCAGAMLDHWSSAPQDKEFRARASATWQLFNDNAAKVQAEQHTKPCNVLLDAERASKIWAVCNRPAIEASASQAAQGMAGNAAQQSQAQAAPAQSGGSDPSVAVKLQ